MTSRHMKPKSNCCFKFIYLSFSFFFFFFYNMNIFSPDLSGQVLRPCFHRSIHYLFSFLLAHRGTHFHFRIMHMLSIELCFYLLLQLEIHKASLPAHQMIFSKEIQTAQQVSSDPHKHLAFIFINTLHMISHLQMLFRWHELQESKSLLLPCQLWEAEPNPVCVCTPQSSDGDTVAKRYKHQAAEITEAHTHYHI